jgi:uncharacterized protein
MGVVKWLTVFAATAYLAALVLLFVFQRNFLYLPDPSPTTPEQAGLTGFEAVRITPEPDALVSWWRPPARVDAPVLIFFHGNGGALAGRAGLYRAIAGEDYGLLAVGYPGYGGNPGHPSEASLFRAADANYRWLTGKDYRPEQIVIAGQSLGTGVAVWLAREQPAAGLLLQSPYTSMADMAAKQMPLFPARYLVKDRYDSISRIRAIDTPVAWVHGRDDTLIPLAMGQRLFDAAGEQKCRHILSGAGHNEMPDRDVAGFFRANIEAMVARKSCVDGEGKLSAG